MKNLSHKAKKLLSLIASCILVLTACFPVITYFIINKKPIFNIAVMSDTHIMSGQQIGVLSDEFIEYSTKGQKMLHISEAIFKTAIDELINDNNTAVLLIAGDLTDDGGKSSHIAVANELDRFEKSGKKAFVIPGNHDINNRSNTYINGNAETTDNVNAEQFVQIYAKFGYEEALARHNESLSYTADLDKNHRLIAIDCSFYEINNEDGYVTGRHTPNMTEDLLNWSKIQIAKCINENKTPIGMIHFPLLPHLGEFVENVIGSSDSKVNDYKRVTEELIKAGLNIVFTGHLHSQDITSYSHSGKTLYDIETAALTNYPMPIRYFNVYRKYYDITTNNLYYVKSYYLPNFISNDERLQINNDFFTYASEFVDKSMKYKVLNKLNTDIILTLMRQLQIDTSTQEAAALAQDILDNMALKYLDMPLYDDDNSEELSVKRICAQYGIDLPQSPHKTVWALFMNLLKKNYAGDEHLNVNSLEAILIKYSLYSVFYVIADYDLFGKLSNIQPSLSNINLMDSMETLFKQDRLPLLSNNLVQDVVKSLRAINSGPLKMIKSLNSSGMFNLLKSLLGIGILFGYDLGKYLDEQSLLLGYLIEDFLMDEIAADLLIDNEPSDNYIRINRKDMTIMQ